MSEQTPEVNVETPIVDADDAKDFQEPEQKSDVDQLAEGLKKAATETAYATVGLVDLVSSKAREFYDDQKKQYATAHPDEDAQTTSGFLTQLGSQLDKLVADIAGGFRDLADRGAQRAGRCGRGGGVRDLPGAARRPAVADRRASPRVARFGFSWMPQSGWPVTPMVR